MVLLGEGREGSSAKHGIHTLLQARQAPSGNAYRLPHCLHQAWAYASQC